MARVESSTGPFDLLWETNLLILKQYSAVANALSCAVKQKAPACALVGAELCNYIFSGPEM